MAHVEDDVVLFVSPETRDLAPMIHRQRLVIEGTPREPINAERICEYLSRLSDVCGMKALIDPVTHRSDKHGWAGWIHWEASGTHFYAWDQPTLFFSVDIYACKPFDAVAITRFTREHPRRAGSGRQGVLMMVAASRESGREPLRELGERVFVAAGRPPEPFGLYVFMAQEPESELARGP